ncbi:MAG: thiamine pyrophosphate-binding protein [Rhizobiales bacterium]|nr:thiamine pyrophosphate-binding protein [Hyphomicrobiales bacterium]
MAEKLASEHIVDCLIEAGIDHVFGLPGGAMMEVYKVLHDREGEIRAVVPRDEQTASCMADMYGKLTGKPGVFIAQGGFAGSTGMFGVIEAYLASSPMLVLSELSDAHEFVMHGPIQSAAGQYGSFDLPAMFKGATKFTTVAHYPREAVLGVQLGIKHALAGRPGPAACLFRSNSLREPVAENGLPEIHDTTRLLNANNSVPPEAALDAAADVLVGATSPVIVAGNGVRISRAFGELEAIAELIGAPVVTSTLGKSAIAETHELAAGPIGYTGLPLANDTVGAADTMLVVGCRLKPQETCFEHPKMFDPNRQRIVQIDVEPRNASWTVPAEVALVGDAAKTLELLHQRLAGKIDTGVVAARRKSFVALKVARDYFTHPMQASDNVPMAPQRLVSEIARAAPEGAVICSDAGNNRHWMNHFFQTKRANCYYGTGGLGGVSWSLPAVLCAKFLNPERPAIGVSSDGGFAMQMHVIMTAVQHRLNPVHVVMNNSRLGMTSESMGNRAIGNEFPDTDYAAIAHSMGAWGERVEKPGEVGDAIAEALKQNRPAVIDVVIDKSESMRQAIYSPLAAQAASGVRPD